MRVLEVFGDITCPFTYVGMCRLLAARDERDLDLILHVRAWPLELVNGEPLAGSFVAHEVAALQLEIAPELFKGFDPTAFPQSSMPAFGLAAAAYDVEMSTGESLSLAVRHAVFERGVDVADPRALAEIGAAFGVAPLPRPEAERRARADYEEGRRRGAVGSPHFFTAAGQSVFCPTLHISKDGEEFHVWARPERLEELLTDALA